MWKESNITFPVVNYKFLFVFNDSATRPKNVITRPKRN